MELAHYASVEQLLAGKTTDTPVFYFRPREFRAAAQRFVAGFPGQTLYAVKANPDPRVVRWLVEGGIRAFDTASLAEMALARSVLPGAHLAYNHPIKPRVAIAAAYREFGIRDYVVDHAAELDKLLAVVPADVVVQVRLAAPNPHATISFNSKFGAPPQEAVTLLRAVVQRGARPAVCTHLGYQTTNPAAYAAGLRLIAEVVATAGVRPAYVNVGGGFPSVLMPAGVTLEDFFRAISTARAAEPALAGVELRCEPGSALTHPGAGVLTQVLLVKEDAIYVNDGLYGALAELRHSGITPPVRLRARDGTERTGKQRSYTVFGPTCDSTDVMPSSFRLPASVAEGDWLQLEMMGAYSAVLISDFNGLGAHEYALVGD
jgi:ornithine decarboxylase